MLDKVRKFYENEYKSTLDWLASKYCRTPDDKKNSINNAIQRCLAIAYFIQELDVPFRDIEPLFTEYRIKFYELLKRAEAIK